MSAGLFPALEIRNNFVLDICYDGPSFNGRINLGSLAEEIDGFSYCLNSILLTARREGILNLNPSEYEFVLAPFKKGSFLQRIVLIPKTIEKYPATTNAALAVGAIFVGIGTIVVGMQANQIARNDKGLSGGDIERIKYELLTDKEFARAYARVVNPLSTQNDTLLLTAPDNKAQKINFSDKPNFATLADEDFEFISEVKETLVGRVTRVDLTATKNALGFKVNDSGASIPASFLDSIDAEERKDLLDKWIEIEGIAEKNGKERKAITIYSYKLVSRAEQEALPFIEH